LHVLSVRDVDTSRLHATQNGVWVPIRVAYRNPARPATEMATEATEDSRATGGPTSGESARRSRWSASSLPTVRAIDHRCGQLTSA
jgi:hypothetical protein